MKPFSVCFLAILILAGYGCRRTMPRVVTPAFYYWQTTLNIAPQESRYLDSLACQKLYVKVLDIGVSEASGAIEPLSRLEIRDRAVLENKEIVPTIFITNAVFKKATPAQSDWLAGKIVQTLTSYSFFNSGEVLSKEVQIDCDWTASTRAAYFLFLKKLKSVLPQGIRLSATIRLHQYKFPEQTGVPPVSRGMLMFYNTGDIESENTNNSIIDLKDASKYVLGAAAHYPIPLDLALPVFSWILIYREGEFWKIINGVPPELSDTTRFDRQPQDATHLQVKRGTFLSGHYLRPGDQLRMETVSPELLLKTADLATQVDLAREPTVAFFCLDTATVRLYPTPLIHAVCQKICFPEKN